MSSAPRGGEQRSRWAFGRATGTAPRRRANVPAGIGQDASSDETPTKGDDESMQPAPSKASLLGKRLK